jgi:hypothetical protein
MSHLSHVMSMRAVCRQCGSRFRRRSELIVHNEAEHAGACSNFACPRDGCDEEFTQRSLVWRHLIRVHKDPIPYVCWLCPARYATSSELHDHERELHGVSRGRLGSDALERTSGRYLPPSAEAAEVIAGQEASTSKRGAPEPTESGAAYAGPASSRQRTELCSPQHPELPNRAPVAGAGSSAAGPHPGTSPATHGGGCQQPLAAEEQHSGPSSPPITVRYGTDEGTLAELDCANNGSAEHADLGNDDDDDGNGDGNGDGDGDGGGSDDDDEDDDKHGSGDGVADRQGQGASASLRSLRHQPSKPAAAHGQSPAAALEAQAVRTRPGAGSAGPSTALVSLPAADAAATVAGGHAVAGCRPRIGAHVKDLRTQAGWFEQAARRLLAQASTDR